MIIINELRITPDGTHLIIDASIENLSYYKNVDIASVAIDTQDTYIDTGASQEAIVFNFESEDGVVSTICDCNPVTTETSNCDCNGILTSSKYGVKHIRLVLSSSDLRGLSLNDNIFFVYIQATGYPSSTTPCGMDNSITMGVVYNLRPWYNYGINFIKELSNTCIKPRGFINYILRFKAFQLALKTGHYLKAIEYWKAFIKGKENTIVQPKRCGCNGTY